MIEFLAAAALAAEPIVLVPPRSTNFGVRAIPGVAAMPRETARAGAPLRSAAILRTGGVDIRQAAAIGAAWGRVTSTWRSAERNRAVGGVRNSFHLSGRAIDIARRAGVRHRDVEAAFRRAGYVLIESLDEGDHSHFAFGGRGAPQLGTLVMAKADKTALPARETRWHIVSAPNSASR